MESKTCSDCKLNQPITSFREGRNICKDCNNKKRKEKYAQNKQSNDTDKTCKECNETKKVSDFVYGSNVCKVCTNKAKNEKRNAKPDEDAPDKVCSKCNKTKPAIEYRQTTNICKECEKLALYEWRKENPEKFKEHTKKQREKEDYREKQNAYKKEKYHTDEKYKIINNTRRDIRTIIRNPKKLDEHNDKLDCTNRFYREWLEFNFTDEMNWDNYGEYWHIDHVIPCTNFDLTNEEEFKQCFHWTNTLPMKASENLEKFTEIDGELLKLSAKKVKKFLKAKAKLINEGDKH